MVTDYRTGIRVASGIASIVAAASGTALHALPANRTAKARKIRIFNHNAVASNVSLGTGLAGAYVAATVAWQVLAGMELTITAEEIPDVEFAANITAAASVAAAAPANVEVQIEVEEFIGISG